MRCAECRRLVGHRLDCSTGRGLLARLRAWWLRPMKVEQW